MQKCNHGFINSDVHVTDESDCVQVNFQNFYNSEVKFTDESKQVHINSYVHMNSQAFNNSEMDVTD